MHTAAYTTFTFNVLKFILAGDRKEGWYVELVYVDSLNNIIEVTELVLKESWCKSVVAGYKLIGPRPYDFRSDPT